MPENKLSLVLERVRAHAFNQLSFRKRERTNLYLDEQIIQPGEMIGPSRQKIVAKVPSLLVFADDEPNADYSHPVRYLFYDAASGHLRQEVNAQFPPHAPGKRPTFKPFHEPVRLLPSSVVFHRGWRYRCPIILPKGQRYALLFSGMSNVRHLNNLEYMYRMLLDEYAFKPDNIYVLNYDGTLNSLDGTPTNWVGDGTAFRMKITGAGTRSAFESAIDELKKRIKAPDLLFLYTGNHGGWDNTPGSADLCTYPNWDGYHALDLSAKLGQLPQFRGLLVIMGQCHSGGFNSSVIAASPAKATSIAASVSEPNVAHVNYDWNYFARDWASAQVGHDPYNNPLAFNPDSDGNGTIEAEEAFQYANAIKYPIDDPVFSESSEAGGDLSLGQLYVKVYWWCPILYEVLGTHYLHLPPEEYYAKLHAIQPSLTKLSATLDEASTALRMEYKGKVERIVAEHFGK